MFLLFGKDDISLFKCILRKFIFRKMYIKQKYFYYLTEIIINQQIFWPVA